MAYAAPALKPVAAPVWATSTANWIQSPAYDLILFMGSSLLGLVAVVAKLLDPQHGMILFFLILYLLGMPHYLSSFTFYLDDEHLAHYRTRKVAFFAIPALLLVGTALLAATHHVDAINSVLFFWNSYHVSMQSAGILNVYRKLNGGPDSEKRLSTITLVTLNLGMTCWFIRYYRPLNQLLAWWHPLLPLYLGKIILLLGVILLIVLLRRIWSRSRPISLPEAAFLITSVALFHPYLWVRDLNLATLGMLTGHYVQYLAIVWLVHKRKYGASGPPFPSHVLSVLARNLPLLLGVFAAIGAIAFGLERASLAVHKNGAYENLFIAVGFVHYYLDGQIWAFRRPFPRQAIGPYLLYDSPRPQP